MKPSAVYENRKRKLFLRGNITAWSSCKNGGFRKTLLTGNLTLSLTHLELKTAITSSPHRNPLTLSFTSMMIPATDCIIFSESADWMFCNNALNCPTGDETWLTLISTKPSGRGSLSVGLCFKQYVSPDAENDR